jgi:hydroxyacylglutathione hydrolase
MLQVFPLRVSRGSFINYTYLVVNTITGEAVLIDPGTEYDTIAQALSKTGAVLKGILLTHHHADHTQLASRFAKNFQVPVYMSRIEQEFYQFDCLNLLPVEPDTLFAVSSLDIFAYDTPGHTRGGTCFRIGEYLFTGDTVFVEGCGICSGAGADPVEMYNSLQKLKIQIPEDTIIYPGHCYGIEPGVSFHVVLRQNLYFHFKLPGAFVRFRMRKNQKGLFSFR